MSEKEIRTDLVAFEDFLARHGSDRTRWPAQERLAYAGLLATSPEAKRLFREAELLDRLLDLAPGAVPAAEKDALAERIANAAFADAAPPPSWAQKDRRTASDPAKQSLAPAPIVTSKPRRAEWAPLAVLAASLVLGLVGGYGGALDNALQPILAEPASVTSGPADLDAAEIALDDSDAGLLGEEML